MTGLAILPMVFQDACRPTLVVSGEPFLRKLVRRALETHGYEVEEATSVQRACERFEASTPELVLLDLWTDRGSGLTFLERLGPSGSRDVRVLLLGSDPRDAVVERARALGAAGPIHLEDPDWVHTLLAEPDG
jgi:CheY-like chemotaxis protein